MKEHVKVLINEHRDLNNHINKIERFVYNCDGTNYLLNMNNKSPKAAERNCIEYANLVIQLKGMKMYRDALTARLLNSGVIIKDCHYMTEVE
jgi:hypothetical protein